MQAPYIDPQSLNHGQQRLFDVAMQCFTSEKPLLMDLNGGAGSGELTSIKAFSMYSVWYVLGKSHVMKVIVQEAVRLYGKGCVRIAAPTGCAAVQFEGGRTLHSLLHLPVKNDNGPLDPLDAAPLAAMQEELRGMQLLIIDEKVLYKISISD